MIYFRIAYLNILQRLIGFNKDRSDPISLSGADTDVLLWDIGLMTLFNVQIQIP